MRQHILINLFEDDFFRKNQLFVQPPSQSSQQIFKMLNNNSIDSITNISLIEESNFSFNNFHDYLGSSYSIIYLIILIITCIEILIGNSLLIYTVFSNKLFGKKLTTSHVVMSLAISDFMIGAIIMPYYIFVVRLFPLTNKKNWHYQIWSNLDSALTTASIYSLCLVTLDRYLAITKPLQYTRNISNRKVKLCIVLIWIVSILTTFLSSILMWILNFIIDDYYERAISRQQIECNVYFHIALTILTFYIPFVLILYFNIATYVTIKRRLTDKKLKISRIESSNRSSSQHILINDDSKQSDSKSETSNLSNDSSNSKLCLNCFNNQNYQISVISGNQFDLNNHSPSSSGLSCGDSMPLRNSFKKKINNRRRCSLCSCHLNRNLKKESINQFDSSYHFSFTKQNSNSLTNGFTWKTFHRLFIEKIKQKHKEGLTKNYTFVFKEYKLVKLLLIMNCCFAFCWGPIYVYQELIRFKIVKVDNHLLNYLLFLGWLNSGADPLIYLHQSPKMRKEIKAKLCCFR